MAVAAAEFPAVMERYRDIMFELSRR